MCEIKISIATREEVKMIEAIAANIMKDIQRNENPESHIKLTTRRGGSKIDFLIP